MIPRRPWILYLFVLSLPALASLPSGLSDYEDEISSEEYAALLASSNQGRDLVLQLTEPAVQDLVVDYVYDHPELGYYEGVTSVRIAGMLLDFDYRFWVRDLRVDILDDEQLEVTLYLEGAIIGSGFFREPSPIGGSAVVTMDLALFAEGEDAETPAYAGVASAVVDPSGVTVDSYLSGIDLESGVRAAMEESISSLESLRIDLSPIYTGLSTEDLPASISGGDPDYGLDIAVQDLAMRTVAEPSTGGEGILMVGANLADIPYCHVTAAESGEHDLFWSDAFERFDASLVAEGKTVALGVSTDLAWRLYWNMTWNMDVDIGGADTQLWHYAEAKARETEGEDFVSDVDLTRTASWDGFLNTDPIAGSGPDAEDLVSCAEVPWGSFVLDTTEVDELWFRTRFWIHIDHPAGCNSSGGLWSWGRFFVDRRETGTPRLAMEVNADYEQNRTWAASFGCGKDDFNKWRNDLQNGVRAANEASMRTLLNLSIETDRYSLDLGTMQAQPATITFSGDLATPLFPAPTARPWTPAVGTIFGLNIGKPDDMILADGQNPYLRACPNGAVSRQYSLREKTFSWCEYVDDDDASEASGMPAGAWCGLDIHPSYRPEICDNVDNDEDGEVDEDFNFDEGYLAGECGETCEDGEAPTDGVGGDPIANCYGETGGRSTSTEDDVFPVEVASTCGGLNPRDACPEEFTQHLIWFDNSYALCLKYPYDPSLCTLSEEEILEGADLVTCVAHGHDFDPALASLLPQGLVGGGYVVAYSDTLDDFLDEGCPEGFESVEQKTRLGQTMVYTSSSTVPIFLGSTAGRLRYCTPTGPGSDLDFDALDPTSELESHGTDTELRSTDADALADGLEVAASLNPLELDTDGDFLEDFTELVVFGVDPTDWDSDDDTLPDGYEVWVSDTDPGDDDTNDDEILDGDEEARLSDSFSWYEGMLPEGYGDTYEGEGYEDPGPGTYGSGG